MKLSCAGDDSDCGIVGTGGGRSTELWRPPIDARAGGGVGARSCIDRVDKTDDVLARLRPFGVGAFRSELGSKLDIRVLDGKKMVRRTILLRSSPLGRGWPRLRDALRRMLGSGVDDIDGGSSGRGESRAISGMERDSIVVLGLDSYAVETELLRDIDLHLDGAFVEVEPERFSNSPRASRSRPRLDAASKSCLNAWASDPRSSCSSSSADDGSFDDEGPFSCSAAYGLESSGALSIGWLYVFSRPRLSPKYKADIADMEAAAA